MNIHQFSKKDPCYFCGSSPPSSKEHVPPKLLFKGITHSSITVPSCDSHNKEKDGSDQGFVTAMKLGIKALLENNIIEDKFSSAVSASIYNVKNDDLLQVGSMRQYIVDAPNGLDSQFPNIQSSVDLYEWVRLITAGLSWSRLGFHSNDFSWNDASIISPNLVKKESPVSIDLAIKNAEYVNEISKLAKSLEWKPGWYKEPNGYPTEVYEYSLTYLPNDFGDEVETIVFRHTFYLNFIFYLIIDLPFNVARKLLPM